MLGVRDTVFNKKSKQTEAEPIKTPPAETTEAFNNKIASPITTVNLRIAVSAKDEKAAGQIMSEIESTFNQLESVHGNKLVWKKPKRRKLKKNIKAFSFREWLGAQLLPLSFTEISTLFHFPDSALVVSPQLKQSRAKTCLLYTSPSPRDRTRSRMPSSA